jgi:hypothetical protein
MASLEHLNELLAKSGELLDQAANEVRDLQLNPDQNVRKLGEVLVSIFEIRLQVFEQRPDLEPDYLKK